MTDATVCLRVELRAADHAMVVLHERGEAFSSSFKELDFSNWHLWLQHQAHGSDKPGKQPEFRSTIEKWAAEVYRVICADEILRQVESSDSVSQVIFLRIEVVDRELDNIPWELLTLPLEKKLSDRQVCVYRAVSSPVLPTTSPAPPQLVLLADSAPPSIPSVNFSLESRSIQHRLNALDAAGLVQVFICENAHYSKLHQAMEMPMRAIHVAAHGLAGQVYLREGTQHHPVDSKAFAEFFKQGTRPVAVMLSICNSAQGAPRAPAVARAVAEAGVAAVLGMYSSITAEAALLFFDSLYRALARCVDLPAAYAEAVATMRDTTYPNSGFWSVPVLYSQENVIPFPKTLGDLGSRYRRLADELSEFETGVRAIQPWEGWSIDTWRLETMDLRQDPGRLALSLEELIRLVRHESRAGSKWAEDVSRSAQAGIAAFRQMVEYADRAVAGTNSIAGFRQCRDELLTVLGRLYRAVSARLRFAD